MTQDNYTDEQLDVVYSALGRGTEFFIIVGRGSFAFRFGPYTPVEAGKLMNEALERKIAITVVGQVGRDMDWQLAEDLGCWLQGHPMPEVTEGKTDEQR